MMANDNLFIPSVLYAKNINTFKTIGKDNDNYGIISIFAPRINVTQQKNEFMRLKILALTGKQVQAATILAFMLLPMIAQAQRQQYQQVNDIP